MLRRFPCVTAVRTTAPAFAVLQQQPTSSLLCFAGRLTGQQQQQQPQPSQQPRPFDPESFAREQERRRKHDVRKAFWSEPVAEAAPLSAVDGDGDATTQSAPAAASPFWGRDAVELVERVSAAESSSGSGAYHSTAAASSSSPSSSAAASARAAVTAAAAKKKKASGSAGAETSAAGSRLQSMFKAYSSDKMGGDDDGAKEKQRRREQLRFREIDYDLDRVRLDRDFFQWFFYLRRGTDYAIDCELERELRYFPEHAGAELTKNLKFMTGASRLTKVGTPFPAIPKVTRLSSLLNAPRKYESDTLSTLAIRVPTVVFVSQLAHQMKDVEDIRPFYTPIMAECLAPALGVGAAGVKASSKTSGAAAATSSAASAPPLTLGDIAENHSDRLDFAHVQTADFQSSIWIRKWLSRVQATRVHPLVAERTYVGCRLLRHLAPIGLRNFGAQYVILLDHTGKIRWLSTGPPTVEEAKWFAEHVRALMRAHAVSKSV